MTEDNVETPTEPDIEALKDKGIAEALDAMAWASKQVVGAIRHGRPAAWCLIFHGGKKVQACYGRTTGDTVVTQEISDQMRDAAGSWSTQEAGTDE